VTSGSSGRLAEGKHSFLGFRAGWAGVLADDAIKLDLQSTAGILSAKRVLIGGSARL
jgi:hypothetical protein